MIDEKKLIERIKGMSDTCNLFRWRSPEKVKQGLVSIIAHEPKISEWIPCSERLPEEPEELPTEDEFIEEMILDEKFKEYIVTIYGGEETTTLYYLGNGYWYDEISSECYKVIAWQPLPETYKEKVS